MLWGKRSIFHSNCDLFDILHMLPRQNNCGHIKRRKSMGPPCIRWPWSWNMGNAAPNPLKWLREIMPKIIYLHRPLLLSRYLAGGFEILLDVFSSHLVHMHKCFDFSNWVARFSSVSSWSTWRAENHMSTLALRNARFWAINVESSTTIFYILHLTSMQHSIQTVVQGVSSSHLIDTGHHGTHKS